MPSPLTVSVDYPRKTPRAKAAVAAFTDGVQAAGISVASDAATTLRLTFLVNAPSGNGEVQQFSDFSWAETEASAEGPPPTITITVGLFGRGLGSLLWVASVECQVKTRDPNVLAREIGQAVGESLGKDVGQTSF